MKHTSKANIYLNKHD